MHIPDGYLSPQTCAAAYAVAVPVVGYACRRVTSVVRSRNVPLLAIFAAVSFLIMMINIPVPDGTSAHAVGAAVAAITLGPWAAVVAVTVALTLQALLFGDGGVLALGANIVNMAILMPFAAWAIYRVVSGGSALDSRRRLWAAGAAGFVGVTVAGLATAVELGIQPILFHSADGAPLYSPYPMSLAVGAMLLAHLVVAGPVEAVFTAGVLRYLIHADAPRLAALTGATLSSAEAARPGKAATTRRPVASPTRIGLTVIGGLLLLTPLGLLAPGGAFAEDAPADLHLGSLGLRAIPEGMNRLNGFWSHTLLADYGFGDGANPVLGYLVSAIVGAVVVGLASFLVAGAVAAISRRSRGVGTPAGSA